MIFEIGDLVRCMKGKGVPKRLVEGKVYKVDSKRGAFLHVKNVVGGWFVERFEKVEKVDLEQQDLEDLEQQMIRISKPQPVLKRMFRPVE